MLLTRDRDCQPPPRNSSIKSLFQLLLLSRELMPSHSPALPILPTPSTIATDARLVALTTCITFADRNSQLTLTRAEDCACAIKSLS